jgi:hypothetical protein
VDRLFTTSLSRSFKERETIAPLAKQISALLVQHQDLFTGPNKVDALVVESQQIYLKGDYKTPNPDDLVILAHVTGLVVALVSVMASVEVFIPQPAEWKAQVPKHIHQSRSYERLGWAAKIMGTRPGKHPGNSPTPVKKSPANFSAPKKTRDNRWALPVQRPQPVVAVREAYPFGEWESFPDEGVFTLLDVHEKKQQKLGVCSVESVVRPVPPEVAPESLWKHLGDALGLALWGLEKIR